MKKLFVIDMMNVAFRAFYGIGAANALSNSKGQLTFLCYGVAVTLNKLLADYKPDYVIVAADTKGHTFRHALFPSYKSGRKPAPNEFGLQYPDMLRMFEAYGITVVRHPATEADDIIGTIAERYASPDLQVTIVSGDKDYMQLIGPNVKMCKPVNGGGFVILDEQAVYDKFACTPDKVIDALAIIGDASDAIPGVKGIGEVGAARLIKAFGSLEGVYENLAKTTPAIQQKLVASRDIAFLSKTLVTIVRDIPVEIDLESCAVTEEIHNRPELLAFYSEMEFASLMVTDGGLVLDMPVMSIPSLPTYDEAL